MTECMICGEAMDKLGATECHLRCNTCGAELTCSDI